MTEPNGRVWQEFSAFLAIGACFFSRSEVVGVDTGQVSADGPRCDLGGGPARRRAPCMPGAAEIFAELLEHLGPIFNYWFF